MASETYRPTLNLQLSSSQLDEIRADVLVSIVKDDGDRNCFTLYPGEANSLQVRLENRGSREHFLMKLSSESLRIQEFFQGAFMEEVCLQTLATVEESHWIEFFLEIPANRSQLVDLHFEVQDDWFERTDAIAKNTPTLTLQHSAVLEVYLVEELGGEDSNSSAAEENNQDDRSSSNSDSISDSNSKLLVGYQTFQIHIRPRSTYLQFLPVLYHRHDFFERFLKIMEEAFDPALQTDECLWAYLDPLTAPEALLPFLAHWVGWEIDDRIDTKIQRKLIRHAVQLHRWRGTEAGLRLYLRLYLGLSIDRSEDREKIKISADLNAGLVLGKTNFEDRPMLGGGDAYHFRVDLRSEDANLSDKIEVLHDIIQQYKPAISTYELFVNGKREEYENVRIQV
jgi:phage tail-like protein